MAGTRLKRVTNVEEMRGTARRDAGGQDSGIENRGRLEESEITELILGSNLAGSKQRCLQRS